MIKIAKMEFIKNKIPPFFFNVYFVAFLVFLITYFLAPRLFFQQDEWLGFGMIIAYGNKLILHRFANEDIQHLVPLTRILGNVLYGLFGLNSFPYNILGLSFHLLNTILILFLGSKLFKSNLVGIIAAIVFLTSASASEFVMWPVISLNTLALTFALLSWLALISNFRKLSPSKLGILCGVLMILGLMFIEYAAGLILFIPTSYALLNRKKSIHIIRFLIPFTLITVLYLIFRFWPNLNFSTNIDSSLLLQKSYFSSLVNKLIKFPISYIGHAFFPYALYLYILDLLESQLFLFKLLIFLIGAFVSLLIFIIHFSKKFFNETKFAVITSYLFILFSSLPFVFKYDPFNSLIAPRYLYFGVVGMALLIAYLFKILIFSKKRTRIILGYFLLLSYVFLGIYSNLIKQYNLLKISNLRRDILKQIEMHYPNIPSKTVFLSESDSTFYGLPQQERIMPFQSGFGQTLLVWYNSKESFPKDFFIDRFLWEIKEQGYKEINGRGFGYFRDFSKFTEAIEKNNIPVDSILSFTYESSTNSIRDNTQAVKGRVTGYFANKKAINRSNWILSTTNNQKNSYDMLDDKRDSYWYSEVPNEKPQSVTIDMIEEKEVAGVEIESFNNKDQNLVGYEVLLSNNGKNWQKTYSSKFSPPDNMGISRLFFLPQSARFVRIGLVGEHSFATWAINELNVYEAY